MTMADKTITVGAVRVPVTGTIGGAGIERAFCSLVHRAIRTRTVNLVAVGRCECLKSDGCRCTLTGGRHTCLLLEDDPEQVPAWRLARRSLELEGMTPVMSIGEA
jgi:hypothetical protein